MDDNLARLRIERGAKPEVSRGATRRDEPTGDLDRGSAGEVLTLMETLNAAIAKTIVMVTHDPSAASRAHRIRYLDKGVLSDGEG